MTASLFSRATPDREETIEAVVEEVLYASDDGRFAVVKGLRTRDSTEPDLITAIGDLGRVSVGETLRLRGQWTDHPSYGRRFRVHTFTPVMPTTSAGMARYLGSGLIPGVGPSLAARLVQHFGEHTLDVITTQSARLREVSGIGPQRAQAIAEAVRERAAEAETMSFLHGLGVGPALARRILRRYGAATVRQVREDPYLVAEEVAGVGFRTADRIGQASGIQLDDPRRAAGAVLHLLGKAADDGHVYQTVAQLREGSLELDVPGDAAESAVSELALRAMVVVDGDAVYAPPLYGAERRLARRLALLARPRMTPPRAAEALAKAADADLSETQRSAVAMSVQAGLMVLTGGPGTGKTTTVRALVQAHLALERRVLLCAPTGRAAKRLAEATGYPARTIHRTLEWNPATGSFKRDEDAPLDAELVLVDEASMLDLRLADSLVAAIPPSSALVLVGDVDQLPPVGAGQVLRDVIESQVASVTRLTEVFRQAQRSAIVRGAHAILDGRLPEPTPAGTKGDGDLFVLKARDPAAATEKLLQLLARMTPAYGLDPVHDVQVLTPMRRGPLGTEALNATLQAALNPTRGRGNAPTVFRPGDKVMQLRNDYDREVWNGDLGEVRRVEGGITYVLIDGREVQYKADDLDALTLAYASTIHKVQGSEFPAVVVVLHGSHHLLLSRALLYTAVTRAKRLVVLLGDERAMARAVGNAVSYRTQSRLLDRLRDAAHATPSS